LFLDSGFPEFGCSGVVFLFTEFPFRQQISCLFYFFVFKIFCYTQTHTWLLEVIILFFKKVDPKMWSCHAFKTSSCNDILLNNIAESFNAWVMEVRNQPILSCLETIWRQLMNRFDKKRERAANATNIMCPKIMKKLERNKEEADDYICH
jgi:hypothetical protein